MGITTAVVAGLGAGFGVSKLMSSGSNKISAPTPLPQPPSVENAQAKADEVGRKKRAAATQSVYTSPLGVAGEANIVRKTLLGT